MVQAWSLVIMVENQPACSQVGITHEAEKTQADEQDDYSKQMVKTLLHHTCATNRTIS